MLNGEEMIKRKRVLKRAGKRVLKREGDADKEGREGSSDV
jgi:hypothetical protein